MKTQYLLASFLFLFLKFPCLAQSEEYEYEVEINIGGYPNGIETIKLMHEGLLCERYSLQNGKLYSNFIERKKLSIEKLNELQEFVHEKKIVEIESIEIPETAVLRTGLPVFVKIESLYEKRHSFLNYNYCVQEIDYMFELLNELIPKKHRKIHHLVGRCNKE